MPTRLECTVSKGNNCRVRKGGMPRAIILPVCSKYHDRCVHLVPSLPEMHHREKIVVLYLAMRQVFVPMQSEPAGDSGGHGNQRHLGSGFNRGVPFSTSGL